MHTTSVKNLAVSNKRFREGTDLWRTAPCRFGATMRSHSSEPTWQRTAQIVSEARNETEHAQGECRTVGISSTVSNPGTPSTQAE